VRLITAKIWDFTPDFFRKTPGETIEEAIVTDSGHLYRNNGDGTFTDVTREAGVGDTSFGMGASAADYDNDGFIDIYVTNFGPNILYRNNGDGTFTDVTEAAGVGDDGLGVSSAFFDYNNDGYLDLYVANYVDSPVKKNKWCGRGSIGLYCSPDEFDGRSDVLYRNNGDGTFTDITKKAGLYTTAGRGLGVVCGDYDNDGDIDIYVANDRTPNFLYRNNGDGTFTDVALFSGVAFNEDGMAEAGMGVDFGDYDNDGDLDIIVINFLHESNTLYRNQGGSFFTDVTFQVGLGKESFPYTAFGTNFFDYDNDGDQDIFCANGHVDPNISLIDRSSSYPQMNQLFRNNGDGTFTEVSLDSGDYFLVKEVSRGAAFGDYDNDGDVDIYVVNSNQRATLLRNEGGNQNNWLMIKMVGRKSNRDGIGARIKVWSGSTFQMDEVKSGSSYASQNDLRMHFGLGKRDKAELIEIRWPSGTLQRLKDVPANQILTVVEPD
ncbi:MAG TPA: CRTAC1 family protein, partial [Candidatus Latescibacteria bacterium]|nr:CRTAC1 family protein [Candidatus Latescibacterota bacterium]